MPDNESPYKLDFDADTREALNREICRRVNWAVEGSQDRNDQLQVWRDQRDGLNITASNTRWRNACNLGDPLSKKAFLTILSQITGALRRDPKVAVESFSKDEEEGARVLESWLTIESSRSNVDAHIYDLAFDACWSQAAVGYVGWKQQTRITRETGWRKPGDARVYSEEEREDGVEYEEVPVAEEVTEEGFDIRVIDLCDFFVYPPDAKSIDRATAVCERMYLTEDELYDGIGDYGYDEEEVERLCAMGPNSDPEHMEIQHDQDGVEPAPDKDGYYQVFTCYTRMPRTLAGGDYDIPKHLMQDDFLVVCAPDQGIVLKMAFSPFRERPYFAGGIIPKKDSILGDSLMAILDGLQAEANGNLQFSIDCNNLTMNPVLKSPKSEGDDANKQIIEPGAILQFDFPEQVNPLEWDRAPMREGLALQQWLESQAQGLVAVEGQGQLSTKVRKAGEIQAVEQAANAKFGMFLYNFQRTIVAELFRRMVALKLQFGDVDDDGEDFVDTEGHSQTLTARALRGKYQIVPVGTSLTHSPEARIEIGKQAQAIQGPYLMAVVNKMPPELLKLMWHGSRELLFDMGIRNPEAWIGEEPKEQPAPEPQPQGQPPQGGPPQQGQPPFGAQPNQQPGVQQ